MWPPDPPDNEPTLDEIARYYRSRIGDLQRDLRRFRLLKGGLWRARRQEIRYQLQRYQIELATILLEGE